MNVPHPQKVISISQIVNRSQARYRIHFNSAEEFENTKFWRQIIKRRSAYAHYEAIVVDHTPEEDIDGLKKFSILYGLKYLFAAEMLNLDIIPVRVLNHPEDLDSRIVTEFFNADYLSLPSYEKANLRRQSFFLEKMESYIRPARGKNRINVQRAAKYGGCVPRFTTISNAWRSIPAGKNNCSGYATFQKHI